MIEEGSVVMVLAKIDERIRETNKNEPVYGTVVELTSTTVWVLLNNLDMFIGPRRDVVAVGSEE